MENSLFWIISALLGAAGAFVLFGPARSNIDRSTALAAWLLLLTAVLDLTLGARLALATPLAPWASALVLAALTWERRPTPKKSLQDKNDETWIQGLIEAQDAIALFEDQHRVLANPAWEELFGSPDDEDRLLATLLTKAEEQGSLSKEKLELPAPSWSGTSISEDLDSRVSIYPLTQPDDSSLTRWLVIIPSRQARHLALFTRLTAHNFNNMLSAIVGGAGMAMDMVAEGSETFRELTEIENMAMKAGELTAQLQLAAREVAPPGPATSGPGSSTGRPKSRNAETDVSETDTEP